MILSWQIDIKCLEEGVPFSNLHKIITALGEPLSTELLSQRACAHGLLIDIVKFPPKLKSYKKKIPSG